MKLHRFTALDNHRAILVVHQKLGPNALIYSTRRIPNGVEVLAGISDDQHQGNDEVPIEKSTIDRATLDKLNIQMQVMEESIEKLSSHIVSLYQAMNAKSNEKKWLHWNIFKQLGRSRKSLTEVQYDQQPAH